MFTSLGAGYSVSAGHTTTTVGAGSGFKVNVLSVFTGVTAVRITNGGGGYSVASGVGTTVGGAQPGVGTGLTIDITGVDQKTPSCAYMMFPNGYSLITPGTCQIVVTSPTLSIACPVNNTGTIGVPYSGQLIASGGTAPYTWAIISGFLPDGLSLDSATGIISGTPTASGTFDYTAQATDSFGQTAAVDAPCEIVVGENLPVAACPVDGGTAEVEVPYSATLQVNGGVAPYAWIIASGSLPPGLSLDSATGVISGTPTTAGTYDYTAQVTDSLGRTATTDPGCEVVVASTIAITCPLDAGFAQIGAPYSAFLVVIGGTAPFTFVILSGALPPGLSLNEATGEIFGVATSNGTFHYVAQVTDAFGQTAHT